MNTLPGRSLVRARAHTHILSQGFAALAIAVCLLVLTSVIAFANTVKINDPMGYLNSNRVHSAASQLSYPVEIDTTNYSGSNSAFDQKAKATLAGRTDLIVIAFNNHHIAITGGKNVPLSSSQYNEAVNAFTSTYQNNSNFTDATVAALNSLDNALQSQSTGTALPGVASGARNAWTGTACCIGLIVLAGLAMFFVVSRNRSRGQAGMFGGFGNRRANFPPSTPNYPNNYPNNYPGGYPPNYQGPYPPQQGMNPWAAGGLGAAAGGYLGYELGKEAGEREEERRDRDDYYGSGGNFGGGNDSGFGGGASGDFGGSNDGGFGGGASGDFGGGNDGGFGGGASGDFGGGNNDNGFGGGSSGNF
jgi:hypothetical protein